MGRHPRRVGGVGVGLLGQSGRQGRDRLASKEVQDFYNSALPDDAPRSCGGGRNRQAWFIKLRGEYADKFKAA